jgi:hypothetical protein
MVGANLQGIFTGLLHLALLAAAAFYTGLVLMSYLAHGPHYRLQVDWHDPKHSAERLAMWLGVRSLALTLRVVTPVFGMLSEASAEVGDWFLSHRHHESR